MFYTCEVAGHPSKRAVYDGFQRALDPTEPPAGATYLVCALYDGEPELWFLDSASAAYDELKRYYSEQCDRDDVPMRLYKV